tara:strand:- start:4576 stop:5460 length:885 start_codon:yes stop_codon:yes gene_type:complete
MANTYTDSSGNVFPLNAYGRPQGYWQGNKFIFPKFGNQPAAVQPAVEPVQPVVQPTNPYRLPSSVQQQQAQDSAGGDPSQLGNTPSVSSVSTTTAPSHGPLSYSGGLFGGAPGVNPAVMQGVGGRLGGLLGPAGALGGSVIGGLAGGRGGRGIAGDIVGTGLGTALLGPLGFLGGIVGGRIGDMKDMEDALALQERGQRGFWSSLGYGFGLGPSVNQQMEDYYGINQPGVDPFGAGGGHPGLEDVDEDDIGDIDPASNDPFGDIADALIGDMFGSADSQFGGDDDNFGGMAAEE